MTFSSAKRVAGAGAALAALPSPIGRWADGDAGSARPARGDGGAPLAAWSSPVARWAMVTLAALGRHGAMAARRWRPGRARPSDGRR
jgi:hypothetical protein